MEIAWVADFIIKTHKAGGAQYSNQMIIDEGLRRGYDIDIITKDDIPDREYDLYILNNLRYIDRQFLDDVIGNKKYIRWEHDYWICGMNKHRPHILPNSLLNLFMSARHLKECQSMLKIKIPNADYVTSPIDTDKFCIEGKKQKGLVVWSGHDRPDNKGFANAIKYAEDNPGLKFKMFGIFKDKHRLPPNVDIVGEVEQGIFIGWLKKAQYLMAVPNWIEPSGRSVMEGILCGCDLIVNGNIGILSENINWNNYNEVVELAHSEGKFWDLVEKLDF